MRDAATEENRQYWNKRSASFARVCGRSAYVDEFIARLRLEEGESVLDMGCGPGTLALPLARAGHRVLACDLSDGMISRLDEAAAQEGLTVQTKLLAWEDDWAAAGMGESSFDVAVASRSLGDRQMAENLDKLERAARSRVAVTVAAGAAPFADKRLLRLLGRQAGTYRQDTEVLRILAEQGRFPVVSYLPHRRDPRFDTLQMLQQDVRSMIGPGQLDDREEALFSSFMAEHAVKCQTKDGAMWHMDEPVTSQWAFIMWRPDGGVLF